MHRLHQTSILILATILLSTSSLSGCRSPAASRAAKEKVEYAKKEASERVLWRCVLQEERTTRANSPIKQASRTICASGILEENPVILDAVFDELQQKANNNESLTELEKIAFEAATKEAQKLDINFSKAQLQIIAQEAVYAFLKHGYRQPPAPSPTLLGLLEQTRRSFREHILGGGGKPPIGGLHGPSNHPVPVHH